MEQRRISKGLDNLISSLNVTESRGKKAKKNNNRRTFSVSKTFKDVHTILDNLPANEASRFICESIRHYHQVKSDPHWLEGQIKSVVQRADLMRMTVAELTQHTNWLQANYLYSEKEGGRGIKLPLPPT